MRLVPALTGTAVTGRDVELRFGEVVALGRSDFDVPIHGVTTLIGPNGSGKSTVLSAIAGLHRPSAGHLSVLGSEPERTRSRVAFVPQSTKVNDGLPVTVREVVAMGRYASLGLLRRFSLTDGARVDAALERLDLGPLSGRHVRELSGGQRQRVFVAQGLVQDRELLLMDEPVNALDMVSAEVIRRVIAEESASGHPVVVTTHDLADARASDQVILLAGRVVAAGSPDEVLTPEHLAEAYRFDTTGGHVHLDDPAHLPVAERHVHVEPPHYDHPGPHDHR